MQYGKVITFGCSITKDNWFDTWAVYLARHFDCRLDNYGERGSGYTFLLQKLLTIKLSTDNFYAIQWPACDRLDLWVNDAVPHLQNHLPLAIHNEDKGPSFVHYNGYSHTEGWFMTGTFPRGMKHEYYKRFYTQVAHVNHAWSTVVAVQNILDHAGVDYIMFNAWPMKHPIQSHFDKNKNFNYKLYRKINFKKFVSNSRNDGFMQFAQRGTYEWVDPAHPGTEAHRDYFKKKILPKVNVLY